MHTTTIYVDVPARTETRVIEHKHPIGNTLYVDGEPRGVITGVDVYKPESLNWPTYIIDDKPVVRGYDITGVDREGSPWSSRPPKPEGFPVGSKWTYYEEGEDEPQPVREIIGEVEWGHSLALGYEGEGWVQRNRTEHQEWNCAVGFMLEHYITPRVAHVEPPATKYERRELLIAAIVKHGPEKFDMGSWIAGNGVNGGEFDNTLGYIVNGDCDINVCGTTACLAGHAASLVVAENWPKDLFFDGELYTSSQTIADFFGLTSSAFEGGPGYWPTAMQAAYEQADAEGEPRNVAEWRAALTYLRSLQIGAQR